MSAVLRWNSMVEAEHDQSERMRRHEPPPADHWQPHAHRFKADSRDASDPLLERIRRELHPSCTLLDVGAGAGRLCLPLSSACRQVVAVEPSPSMVQVLNQQASDLAIRNVSVVEASWEDAVADPADIVLCCHVLYVVKEIAGFVRKLASHARETVLVVLFDSSPQASIYPLWKRVHGEDRLSLPALPEFLQVLSELGIDPQVDMLPPQQARGFDSQDQALEELARRLYLAPGSREMADLEAMLPDLLKEVDGALTIKGSRPHQLALVAWRP